MDRFNVIIFDHGNGFKPYNILPYFKQKYRDLKPSERPKTEEALDEFLKQKVHSMFWGRCEWEIILLDWPRKSIEEKWDVSKQIHMNWDLFKYVFKQAVNFKPKKL